jgi:hypothetical protein
MDKPRRIRSKEGDLFIVMKERRQIALGLCARGGGFWGWLKGD